MVGKKSKIKRDERMRLTETMREKLKKYKKQSPTQIPNEIFWWYVKEYSSIDEQYWREILRQYINEFWNANLKPKDIKYKLDGIIIEGVDKNLSISSHNLAKRYILSPLTIGLTLAVIGVIFLLLTTVTIIPYGYIVSVVLIIVGVVIIMTGLTPSTGGTGYTIMDNSYQTSKHPVYERPLEKKSVRERLEELEGLRRDGLISEEDYHKKKEDILKQL